MRSAFASDFTGYFAATLPDRDSFMDGNVPFPDVLPIRTITFLQSFYMLSAFCSLNKDRRSIWNAIPEKSIQRPHAGDICHVASIKTLE